MVMAEAAVNIWVSAGSLSSPFYRFYTNESGTSELRKLILDPSKTYTFLRSNEATSHPFYFKADPANSGGASDYNLSGDGSSSAGITGNQSFTLSFSDPSRAPVSLVGYCTIHSSMQSTWSISQASVPEPTPEPEPVPEPEPTPDPTEPDPVPEDYEPPATNNEIIGTKKMMI